MPTETREIPLDQIEPSPLNPRRDFAEDGLRELADSLRASGLIQPIVVRAVGPEQFSLLAGERRWRAARLAGWQRIPAVVREAEDDAAALAVMLAENLQREDLTAIEQARAYQRLMELGISQSEIARRTGKAQPTVSNTMRLLELPEGVRQRVQSRDLAPAAARALLPLAGFPAVCEAMAERVVAHEIPARLLERDVLATREWELERAGVVRHLNATTPWEWRTRCRESCPFGAYRDAHGTPGGVCLKPEHWEELVREAGDLSQREAAALERIGGPHPDEAEREQRAALWEDCLRLLDGGRVLADARLVALLCVDVIAETRHETLKGLAQREPVPEALLAQILRADPTRAGIAAALSQEPPTRVARLALLCLLRTEAEEAAHRGHPPRLAQWLLGESESPRDLAANLRGLVAEEAA